MFLSTHPGVRTRCSTALFVWFDGKQQHEPELSPCGGGSRQ
ncbi:hypothetical protein [uncultured Flavonifractor sp.]|nr:hypothetical protein [uncultured Flavonifractor sp.]